MADYRKMTVPQLEKESAVLDRQMTALRNTQQKVHDAIEVQEVTAAAEAKVATMSDPERAALAQAINAAPIASEETVGEPGAG